MPEVAGDVISAVDVEHVDIYVRVKFGASRSIRSRDIRSVNFVEANEQRRMAHDAVTGRGLRRFIYS